MLNPPAVSDPRTVTDSAFPRDVPADVQLRFMLNDAVLVPSVLNPPPWNVAVGESSVRIYADRSRQLCITDPLGRALAISCGAARMNLRLATHYYGYEAPSTLLPDDPDELACGTGCLSRARARTCSIPSCDDAGDTAPLAALVAEAVQAQGDAPE